MLNLKAKKQVKSKAKQQKATSEERLNSVVVDDLLERQTETERNELVRELISYKRISLPFLFILCCLTCFGLVMLYSSGFIQSYLDSDTGSLQTLIIKQLGLSLIGVVAAGVIALAININWLNKAFLAHLGWIVTTFLLVAVIFFGQVRNGANRWLSIGGIDFQPSEIAKFMTVYFLAVYFADAKKRLPLHRLKQARNSHIYRRLVKRYSFYYIVKPAVMIGIWLGLIVFQPHLSCTVIIVLLSLAVFVVAGIPKAIWLSGLWRLFLITLALILLAMCILPFAKGESLGDFLNKHFSHVKTRAEIYSESDQDTQNDQNYQIIQARRALGSGGLTGVGLGESRQKFNFLPSIHNDYIFSGIGEELGFIGCMAIILLFIALFMVGLSIAIRADNIYASLLAWGYSFLLFVQALLNIAVATEVIPATGISLPFFSYGGTANIVFLIEAGIVLAVSRCSLHVGKTVKELLA